MRYSLRYRQKERKFVTCSVQVISQSHLLKKVSWKLPWKALFGVTPLVGYCLHVHVRLGRGTFPTMSPSCTSRNSRRQRKTWTVCCEQLCSKLPSVTVNKKKQNKTKSPTDSEGHEESHSKQLLDLVQKKVTGKAWSEPSTHSNQATSAVRE